MVQAQALLAAATVVALQIIVAVAKTDPFAGLPPMTAMSLSKEEQKKHPQKKPKTGRHRGGFVPRASFDSAVQWPQCESIKTIRNQGACGDCWAVSAASVISDRLCIASGIKDFVSGTQVAGCSYPDYTPAENCDKGGNGPQAYQAAALKGVVTGGEYQSNVGCVPYSIGSTSDTKKDGITCPKACSNSKYGGKMATDYTNHQIDSYWSTQTNSFKTQTEIDNVVLHMQEEIFNNGPITANIKCYSDFATWKPEEGPYRGPKPGATLPPGGGGHAVRITGWGVEKGIKYWIIANSWGTKRGKDGLFHVEMGKNIIDIEHSVAAPIVNISKTVSCSTAKFCSAPIDQAARMNYADPSSAIFLFQGECLLEVKKSGSKLVPVGQAVPIGKRILNAPKAPVVTVGHFDTKLAFVNAAGECGDNCEKAAGTTKYTCDTATTKMQPSAYAVTPTGTTYSLKDPAGTLFVGSVTASSSRGYGVGDAFTSVGMTPVAFLDIDGTKAFVFGKDKSGKPSGGIMNYPQGAAKPTFSTPPGAVSSILQC